MPTGTYCCACAHTGGGTILGDSERRPNARPLSLLVPRQSCSRDGNEPMKSVPEAMNSFANRMSIVVADPRGYTPPYDYSLCNALAQRGCDVLLASSELGPVKWNLKAHFPVWNQFYSAQVESRSRHSRRAYAKFIEGLEHVLGMRRFTSLVRKRAPQLIHFQWLPLPVLDQLFISGLKRRAGLVLTLHNTTLFHGVVSHWRGLGFRSALKQFDALIVHTEFSRQRVLASGWAEENKVHVMPHGVLDYYSAQDTGTVAACPTRNLLFFGNLHPYKGVDVLLRAFARLSPAVARDLRLVIAGRPEMDVEPLRQLSRQLGIEARVNWMLRPIAESEVPELFRSATAVVLPYREIDQSGVLMTAIAFGKPVLATRVGGVPEVVQDGIHGYLVPPDDAQELALASDRLLSSRERRQNMERSMRSLREGKLAWANIASKTLDLYRDIIERRSRSEVRHPGHSLAGQEACS